MPAHDIKLSPEKQMKLEELRTAIQEGMKGPYHDGPTAMAALDKYIDSLSSQKKRRDIPA